MKHIIDARGKACPQPVVMTIKVLDQAAAGDVAEVLVDNEIAVENLSRLAGGRGCTFVSQKKSASEFLVQITVKEGAVPQENEIEECEDCAAVAEEAGQESPINKGLVVAIGSDRMGEGSEELGRILVKGFLYALGKLPKLPETVLFFNGGAKLTTEGSGSLADLKLLEEQGVRILTCGTCLDYFKLKEKLAVGSITDMYTITETLADARKVVRP